MAYNNSIWSMLNILIGVKLYAPSSFPSGPTGYLPHVYILPDSVIARTLSLDNDTCVTASKSKEEDISTGVFLLIFVPSPTTP